MKRSIFARADRLGDPFEGSLSAPMAAIPTHMNDNGVVRAVTDQERDMFTRIAPSTSRFNEAQRRWTYVSCWNHSRIELDALWGRYVRSDAGIAIRSSFQRLTRSFGEPLPPRDQRPEGPVVDEEGRPTTPVFVGRVSYVDYATSGWPPGNTYWPYVHKRLSFQDEREVRALISNFPVNDDGIDYDATMPLGIDVHVDVDDLVESIFISPVAPDWLFELVLGVCRERYKLVVPVVRSQLWGSPRF